jgi:hypothetical protein
MTGREWLTEFHVTTVPLCEPKRVKWITERHPREAR